MDKTLEFLVPSGLPCEIRMQNGEDDEILSSVRLQKEGNNINAFVAAIVNKFNGAKLTLQDVIDMRLSDKYYILIQSRVFSLGDELEFDYTWDKEQGPIRYTEDLNTFLWDYSKPFPYNPEDEGYHPHRIKPFPFSGENFDYHYLYFELGGRKFRMRHVDGRLEKYLIKCDDINNNSLFYGRELSQLFMEMKEGEEVVEKYIPVTTFKAFIPREMAQLRGILETFDDGNAQISMDLENPNNPGEVIDVPLLSLDDFLSPRLI